MKSIIGSIMVVAAGAVLILVAWFIGRDRAFDDIILEKCWLNKETKDIECISRVLP